ncbi:hypothetical protein D9619_001874 [Psilocybe cf. subviscida]|uniref:Protein FAM72 n=1 Tax=Psilocybe cf. subviscida TaxID=2480587 RepID=A0A8H5F2R9_9AGAR|nr:hypothetical protein D9619_001874 [Psilocybe cf. subviscida]
MPFGELPPLGHRAWIWDTYIVSEQNTRSAVMPSSLAHKVWILDCSQCSMFLTNRAMKAVLLLRPNVSLYSSDALPVNCSAHNAGPEPTRAASSHKHNASPAPARTCECLTQSLSCHGCGSTIGYMIVNPCSRCTSSISATNRATNGHRFVFHSNEVTGTERYYVHGEPGVVPYDPPQHAHPHPPQYQHPDAYVLPPFTSHPVPSQSPNPRSASPVVRADYLPTPPLEFATPHWIRHQSPEYDASPAYYRQSRSPPPFVPAHPPSQSQSRRSTATYPYPSSSDSYASPAYRPATRPRSRSPPPLASSTHTSSHPSFHPYPHPADHKEQELPAHPAPSLKSGDLLFWHHLARSGEIPGVADNKLARTPAAARTPTPRRAAATRLRDVTFNR